jgi:hypothetical protein
MMWLDAIKCDYDATKCNIIILGSFFSLKMPRLAWAKLINNISWQINSS